MEKGLKRVKEFQLVYSIFPKGKFSALYKEYKIDGIPLDETWDWLMPILRVIRQNREFGLVNNVIMANERFILLTTDSKENHLFNKWCNQDDKKKIYKIIIQYIKWRKIYGKQIEEGSSAQRRKGSTNSKSNKT